MQGPNNQWEQRKIPSDFTSEGKRWAQSIHDVLDEIYAKYGRLNEKDLSKAFVKRLSDAEGGLSEIEQTAQNILLSVSNTRVYRAIDQADLMMQLEAEKVELHEGLLWQDTALNLLMYYNGTSWVVTETTALRTSFINIMEDLIEIKSGGGLEVASGGLLEVKSGGNIDVSAGGTLNVKSGSNLEIRSGGKLGLWGADSLVLETGASMMLKSGSSMEIKSEGNLDIASGAAFNLRAGVLSSSIGISNNETNQWFLWAGHETPSSAPFRVDMYGNVYAKNMQQVYSQSFWDMSDNDHPAEFFLYIPMGYFINSVMFSTKVSPCRTFAKTARAGSGSTGQTTDGANTGGVSVLETGGPNSGSFAGHTHNHGHTHSISTHTHNVGTHTHPLDFGVTQATASSISGIGTWIYINGTDWKPGPYYPDPGVLEIKNYVSAGWNNLQGWTNSPAKVSGFVTVKLTAI